MHSGFEAKSSASAGFEEQRREDFSFKNVGSFCSYGFHGSADVYDVVDFIAGEILN